jgi:restriction system protein
MSVPDFQSMFVPLLSLASDQQEHSMREAIELIAEHFALNDVDRNEFLPSGKQRRLDNRVGWARTHLTKAGLLMPTTLGHFRISDEGLKFVSEKHDKISLADLDRYPSHLEFRKRKKDSGPSPEDGPFPDQPPREAIDYHYQRLREALAQELLDTVKQQSPAFFERMVVELLVAMGYGGSIQDAGQAIGKSGDGGIDGIIKEDKLGLDNIYIQAKRWADTVGRPEIQKFAGALMGRKSSKGVFITTSSFSPDAHLYVREINSRIVLIDGKELAQLMIDYDIGITRDSVYEIKRINSDYFTDA